MPKRLLTIVYPGFADWEVTFPLFCIHPHIEYQFLSLEGSRVRGCLGFEVDAQWTLDTVKSNDFDGVLLPGGRDAETQRFPRSLGKNAALLELLRDFAGENKVVAAICGAPMVLGAAGLLHGRPYVCDATGDTHGWLDQGTAVEDEIAVAGDILTGRVKGIVRFSATLTEMLGEADVAREIEKYFGLGRR